MNHLSPRQEAFIDGVLRGLSHAAAAREAGYCAGSQDDALRSYASVLYANLLPEIEARRLKAVVAVAEEVDLSVQRTLVETWHHAHYDPRRVVGWGPDGLDVKPSKDLTPDEARLVKAVACTVTEKLDGEGKVLSRTVRTKVDLVDRQSALARLAEYQGLTGGDPNLGMRGIGSREDDAADAAKLAEQIHDVPTAELLARWKQRRAAAERLPVPV